MRSGKENSEGKRSASGHQELRLDPKVLDGAVRIAFDIARSKRPVFRAMLHGAAAIRGWLISEHPELYDNLQAIYFAIREEVGKMK